MSALRAPVPVVLLVCLLVLARGTSPSALASGSSGAACRCPRLSLEGLPEWCRELSLSKRGGSLPLLLVGPITLPSGDAITVLLTGEPYLSGRTVWCWGLTGLVARVESPGRAPRFAGRICELVMGCNVAFYVADTAMGWNVASEGLVAAVRAAPLGRDALVIEFPVGLSGNSGASAVFVLTTTPSPRLSLAYVDPVFGFLAGPGGRVRLVTFAEREYVTHATRDARKQVEEVSVTGRMRRIGRWPLPAGLGTEWTDVPPLDSAWTAIRWMREPADGGGQGDSERSSASPH